VPDLEKTISRIGCGYTHPKDLLAIRNTLQLIPALQTSVNPLSFFNVDDIPRLRELLASAVNEEMPLSHHEGKVIRPGFNKELDELRRMREAGRGWLKEYQQKEIRRSGISSLKVGYTRVFGYYIEVTNTHLKNVPADYIRKQTLVNAERFITPELKSYEENILSAEEKILKVENTLIEDLSRDILDHSAGLHRFCEALATWDALLALSFLAGGHGYIRPKIDDSFVIDIKDGRHPVVEKQSAEKFICNDTLLDNDENHLIILTGPNMAGKSTWIRQSAILTLMAQAGSWVPAASARFGIVDKIFTRIGAHDDISRGASTFMVEMNEMAEILNNLSERSLIILDEIGRGTSTYDGLSLAWALAEHLAARRPRTLFATHFHELTALADEHAGVRNYNVAVKEWKDEIIFLHKIIPGGCDDSYGIHVAKLAGIPESIIGRARKILTGLELHDVHARARNAVPVPGQNERQLNLFAGTPDPMMDEIKDAIASMDVNNMTPVEALNELQKIKEKLDM
jgi:DNA mismatch repair protein MutS